MTGLVLWLGWVVAAVGAAPAEPGADQWEDTLERVTRAVVSIEMDRPRAFEGVGRGNSQATGFVIDRERGLILTNRHVVTEGPTRARATFADQEEVELVPVYRDPIHDFGLFAFDPARIRFQEVEALALRPDKARPGVQIRVVGNDSGEQLSILAGTLARLDREAPTYGGSYSDYDTFYIQAASGTSGGSSGSPVVDAAGDVVALNAGAKTTAAASFFLPLDRVVRAVDAVLAGREVPRGSLQTRMVHTPYDELRRLGLSAEAEAAARARWPKGTGLLVVRDVLAEGPAAGKLRVGDLLLEIGGVPVQDFVTFEGQLDDHVGRALPLVLERAGRRVEAEVTVADLHELVPHELLEIGGAVLHDLSIHQARLSQVPIRGVAVADNGWMLRLGGVPDGAVIVEVGGAPVADLAQLVAALSPLPDGAPFSLRWYSLNRPQQVAETSARMDRRWFPARTCARDDTTGDWPCADLPAPTAALPDRRPVEVGFPPTDDRTARRVLPSLVRVRAELPVQVAGVPGSSYVGMGLVVDATEGLVVVDRDTVPVALAEVRLEIAGAVEVPARVVALHPVHGFAVLRYDPKDANGIPLTSAAFVSEPLGVGDTARYVGLDDDGTVIVREVEVEGIGPIGLRADGPPRFRDTNLEVLELKERPSARNGVLVDRKGRVAAFWASLSYTEGRETKSTMQAVPVERVREALALARGEARRALPWELGTLPLPKALERGLPAAEAERLVAHDPERRAVIQVARIEVGDPLADVVRTGDLVLAVDGVPVTRYPELEEAVALRPTVRLTLCRNGALEDVVAPTQLLETTDVERVVVWAGVRVHATHRPAQLMGFRPGRPYVAWWEGGSPAGRARLYPQRQILTVDGQDTPDLDAFVRAILARPAGAPVRFEVVTQTGEREVVVVEPDERFFPTEELVRGPDGAWSRRALR